MRPKIGITFNSTIDLFYSGANQTALLLTELFSKLDYDITLINLKLDDNNWWNNYPKPTNITISTLYDTNGLECLIDIDGTVNPTQRKNIATKSIVFLRSFVQFKELDLSVYPENKYLPRNFDNVNEIWCWDILNPPETLDSISVIFPCPIRTVPFIWSPTLASYFSKDNLQTDAQEWVVHIAEKGTNDSSSVMPLVAVRELYLNNHINAKYKCHNIDHIKENKFFKENVLKNIQIEKLPIEILPKTPFYEWAKNKNILFSHSRFVPLRIGLLNAIWLGLPVIHNSPIIRNIHTMLNSTFYFGNEVDSICKAFKQFINEHNKYYEALSEIRENILKLWSIDTHLEEWRQICNNVFTEKTVSVVEDQSEVIIAFSDFWPGFNYNTNFIMDALRHESNKKFIGINYEENIKPNIVICGPYSQKWRNIPNNIPKVYFSAENWQLPNSTDISLFITSSQKEDNKHIRIPTWITFIDWFSGSKELPITCQDNPIRIPVHFAMTPHTVLFKDRPEFCGFVVSNPICAMRNNTFQVVNNYKKVNSGGALYNNIGGQLALKYPGGGCGDISKLDFFSKHKFTISFENSQADGYITEKVLHAKMAGCVPIYWGDKNTDLDFVANSFINVSNVSSPETVLEVIKKLEANPEFCNRIASTPILDEHKKNIALTHISKMTNKILDLINYPNVTKNTIPNKIENIDKIYCINLDTRKDRWNNLMAAEPYLKDIVTRVSGVNGKTLKMNKFIYNLFAKNQFQWKKSVIGCNLSHINTWSKIATDSGKYFLVLEDDVRFKPNWIETWNKCSEFIPEDAELLYLGGVLPPNKPALPHCLESVNEYWSQIKPNRFFSSVPAPVFHFCAYSYILTKKGAQKILDYLTHSDQKSFTVSDHLLGSPAVGLKKYIINPLLSYCFQEDDPIYTNSQFNDLHRKDTFDSDIWNNTECFSDQEIEPFRNPSTGLTFYYVDEGKPFDLYEKEWIQEIFGLIPNFKALDFMSAIPNNSWIIVQRPHLEKLNKYFEYLNSSNIPFRVLHLSDEFRADNISFYKLSNCKAVIRNYLREDIPEMSHIITVPLGFHHKGSGSKTFDEKKLIWSFQGTEWFDRPKQVANLSSLIPHLCKFTPDWNHSTMANKETYLGVLENSKFVPILRGNNIETFRLYESLEIGSIPIYIRSDGDELYYKWISSHIGLPDFKNWSMAVEYINHLLGHPNEAEVARKLFVEKWKVWKMELCSKVKSLL